MRYSTAMYPFLKVSNHEFSSVNQFENLDLFIEKKNFEKKIVI